MRIASRIAVIAAATTLTVLGAASGAQAGRDATSSVTGSTATFLNYGDKFRVCDTSLDGWNSYVDYNYVRKDGSYQEGAHFVTSGNGTCGTFDHDFGEGRVVNFRACVEIFPYTDICADWKAGVA